MTTPNIADLPASAFAGNPCGHKWCGTLVTEHSDDTEHGQGWVTNGHREWKKTRCWCSAICRARAAVPPDTTLVKSSRPATCAVCREVVTGSIELPTGEHCCGKCCCIALRNMIDDAAERTDR